jgi:hypothetical protein
MRLIYSKFSLAWLFICIIQISAFGSEVDKPISKNKETDKPVRSDRPRKVDGLPNPVKTKRRATSVVVNPTLKSEAIKLSAIPLKGIEPQPLATAIEKVVGPDPFAFSISSNKDSVSLGEELELTIKVNWVDFGVNSGVKFLPEWYKYALKVVMPKGFIQTGGDYVDYCTKLVDAQNPEAIFTVKGIFEYPSEENVFKVLRGFEGAGDGSEFIFKTERNVEIKFQDIIYLNGNSKKKNKSSKVAGVCTQLNPIKIELKSGQNYYQEVKEGNNYILNNIASFDSVRIKMPFTGDNVYQIYRIVRPGLFSGNDLKVDSGKVVITRSFGISFTNGVSPQYTFLALKDCDSYSSQFLGFTFKFIQKNCTDTLGTIQAFATNPISVGQTLNLTSVYKNPSGVVSSLPGGATLSWYKGGTLISSTTYPNINGYANGNYTVKVALGNCQASSTVNVSVPCNNLNTPELVISNITPSGCQEYRDSIYTASGQKVSLVNKAYCAGTTYWSNGATGIKIDVYPTLTTTYTAYCKDSSCVTGNSNSIKVNVTTDCNKILIGRPNLYVDNNKLINLGDSLTLSINGYCSAYNSITEWTNGTTTILAGTKVAPTQNKNFYVRCKNGACVSPYDTLRVFVKCGSVAIPTLSYYNAGSSTFPVHYAQANGCTGTVSWFNNNTYVGQGNRFLLSEYPGQNLKYPKAICSVNGCSSDFSAQFNSATIPLDPNQDYSSTLNGSMNKTPNGSFYSFKCGESAIVSETGCRNDKPKWFRYGKNLSI